MSSILSRIKRIYTAEQFFAAILAAVIIAGIAGYFIGRSSVAVKNDADTGAAGIEALENNSASSSNLSATGETPGLSGEFSVSADDQPDGNSVAITSAKFPASGGWIAVHESREGAPGNVLGAKYYNQGETKNSAVLLLRPTVSGVYYAIIHFDDGDHQFDLLKDLPVKSASGGMIMARFIINEAR